MDPYTALATAGNILQFVQFVGGLLSSTRKLHASATGITVENEHIQDIREKLIAFSDTFQQLPRVPSREANSQLSQHDQIVRDCALACSKDCEELLRILAKLQITGSSRSRYWRSFQAALTEVWNSGNIEELKARITDRQRAMTLQLSAISKSVIYCT